MCFGKSWFRHVWIGLSVVAGVAFFGADLAWAETTLSEVAIQIEAESSSGAGTIDIGLESLVWDPETQSLGWEPDAAVSIVDSASGTVIATLESAELHISECSRITLGLQLLAGEDDTTFVLRSGKLSFAELRSDLAEGRATAAFTVRDLDGDGAVLLGEGGGGAGAYRAYYNGLAPGRAGLGWRRRHRERLAERSGGRLPRHRSRGRGYERGSRLRAYRE
jgi:hypothetical protein